MTTGVGASVIMAALKIGISGSNVCLLYTSSEEILEALEEPLDVICEATHGVLEKTPPELAADVGERGIVITGGGAHLRLSLIHI